MASKRCWFAGLVFLLAVNEAFSSDLKAVEKQSMSEFYGKNLLLNHAYLNNKLRFNPSGELVGNSEEGPWTMNGILHVEEIELKSKQIRLSGRREIVVLRTENDKLGLQPILLTKRMTVELESAGTIATLEDVRQAVSRVFHEENIARKINSYWRGNVKITGVNPKTGQLAMDGGTDGIYGYLGGDRPVYFLNAPNIQPPKVIHKEDVDYTRAASEKRTHGKTFILLVINEKGYPELLQLIKDLGDDLDVQSLGGTSQYRFRPATKDGQPVACVIKFEWEFTTY